MSYSLIQIEGIGEAYKEKLRKRGIRTTDALLERCRTPEDRKSLAGETGIAEKLILEWANLCDLMRVRGVGEEWADLLEEAGVDTVKELRHRDPENLYETMVKINDKKKLVRRVPPLVYVENWVAQSHYIEAMLEY